MCIYRSRNFTTSLLSVITNKKNTKAFESGFFYNSFRLSLYANLIKILGKKL